MHTLETRANAERENETPLYANSQGSLIDFACCALLTLLCLLVQVRSHAYVSDFSLDPDEPAHAVSSLMVHDYLVHLSPANPLSYAQNFYDHYPKVAIGHWPPLFYVCEGVWTVVFGRTRAALLSFVLITGTALVCSVYLQLRRHMSFPLALLAASLLLISTSFDQLLCAVRPDLLLTLVVFWAAVAIGRYVVSRSSGVPALYLLLTTAACLIHGRGALLLLTPFATLLLTGRRPKWRWLLAGAFIVPLFLLPPLFQQGYVLTASTMRAEVRRFTLYLCTPLHVVALACVIFGTVPTWRREDTQSFGTSMSALLVSGCLFLLLVPAGWDARYLITVLPASACLVALGVQILQHRLVRAGTVSLWWSDKLVLACAVLALSLGLAHIPVKPDTGAHALAVSGLLRDHTVALVAGNARDEGAFIAEAVLEDVSLKRTVLRASKSLALIHWSGDGYRERFTSSDQVAAFLDQRQISLVLICGERGERPDIQRLRSVVTGEQNWKRSLAGAVEVYRR